MRKLALDDDILLEIEKPARLHRRRGECGDEERGRHRRAIRDVFPGCL